jgi:hypothetical protein
MLMPVILATEEAAIRRISVQDQPGQIRETLSRKNPSQKRAGGVVQGIDPEFKPQYGKNKEVKEAPNPCPPYPSPRTRFPAPPK